MAGLREQFPSLGFIAGKFFLTKCESVPQSFKKVRGVELYGLKEWRELIEIGSTGRLSVDQARRVASRLWLPSRTALDADLVGIGPVSELELMSSDRTWE